MIIAQHHLQLGETFLQLKPLGFGSHSPFLQHIVLFGPISSPEGHINVMISPVMGGFLLSVLLIIIDIESDIPSDS